MRDSKDVNAARPEGEMTRNDARAGTSRPDQVAHPPEAPSTGSAPDEEGPAGAEDGSGSQVREEPGLRGAERLPRLGNEEEKPYDDRYGE